MFLVDRGHLSDKVYDRILFYFFVFDSYVYYKER